jgi:type IV secretory pathway component VirB8
MDEAEILKKLAEQDKKLDAIYRSAEKTRKYFLWTLIISVAVIVLPLIALAFILPIFLQTLNLGGLGL